MSNRRYFALILGIVFLLVGLAAFIPGMVRGDGYGLRVTGPGTGYLLGLFHVNVLHNLVHILFGLLGLAAYAYPLYARTYARGVAIAYLVLGLIGMIPNEQANTLCGLVPIHGNDVWLHLLIAAVSAVFGWAHFTDHRPMGVSTP